MSVERKQGSHDAQKVSSKPSRPQTLPSGVNANGNQPADPTQARELVKLIELDEAAAADAQNLKRSAQRRKATAEETKTDAFVLFHTMNYTFDDDAFRELLRVVLEKRFFNK